MQNVRKVFTRQEDKGSCRALRKVQYCFSSSFPVPAAKPEREATVSPATVSSLAKVHPGNGEPSCNGDQPNGDDPSDGDPSGSDPSGSEPSSVGLDTGQGHHPAACAKVLTLNTGQGHHPAACAMGLTLNTGQSRHSSSGTKGLDTGTTRPVLQPAKGEEK
ncbi:uncharacterized protein isoform X2 [Salmo salar]|uniref:Uncharacterized protein isoform X2 n=1 Tax=Salmo salar TaxID=8030 RepID=A0A1S3KMN4_SALSA|nr:uncharacterized protein LOC106560934 isoform X2 [Salmo salar]|eukprot:XP_013979877.1 PREDICTED: uncharacterized protein LOC106560934 isoform X2 [Salmo salar]